MENLINQSAEALESNGFRRRVTLVEKVQGGESGALRSPTLFLSVTHAMRVLARREMTAADVRAWLDLSEIADFLL